jgi:signal transduction histidine kinase
MSETPYRILIIEDSAEDRESYRRSIARKRDQDYLFWETDSVEEGLRLSQELNPDCILLDYQLSDADGLEFLDRFQRAAGGASIPIVMLTGHGNEAVAVQAMKKGVHDYLVKGLNNDGLHLVVRAAIDHAVLRRRIDAQRLEVERLSAERLSLIAELERHAAALSATNRSKDEFLAMLAHELRNPLAAIRNALTVADRSGEKEDLDWSHQVINRQVLNLGVLIDDLLDVARITQGKIQLRRERVDAARIIQNAVETVRPLLVERNHELACSFPPSGLHLDADRTRLEQILVNLLSNAVKYTPPGGHIQLTGGAEGGEVIIGVRDDGIGISPEMLPRLFDLFTQVDRSLDRSEGGLGIGLTVAKTLAQLHGGTITAMSDGPGSGSEFVVRLPAVEAASEASRLPAAPAIVRAERRQVLVVDDNVDTAEGMAKLLTLSGHGVRIAASGPEAIEVARGACPDAVLLDIGLPGMDGYEVARVLRQQLGQDVRIIAVSGYGDEETRRRARESGFDHHFVKPVDHDTLLSLLNRPRITT